MGQPVRCAVVGLGLIGTEHAAALSASPAAELVVCCDVDERAGGRIPAGVAFSTDLGEALSYPGLEAVFVCTPEFAHRAPVEEALARGFAVFCEKPVASTIEDAAAMIEAANRARGTLVVGHLLRFDLRYASVANAVQSGQLGRPIHLFARRTTWLTEGKTVMGRTSLPLYLGVHDLDVFRWLAGDIARVYAEAGGAGAVGEGIPDSVVATVRFTSGAVGLLELSWATSTESGVEWDSRLAFIGTQGSAYVDIDHTGVRIFSGNGPSFPDTTYWPRTLGTATGILRSEDEHFLRLIREGRPWPVSMEDALAAVKAALALDASVQTGRPVALAEQNGAPLD
jgi:predicted dehydrogenase